MWQASVREQRALHKQVSHKLVPLYLKCCCLRKHAYVGKGRHAPVSERGGHACRRTLVLPASSPHSSRRRRAQVSAGKSRSTGNEALDKAISVGQGFVDSAAEFVPESVPRPVAKGGVAVAGVLVAFWILQKVCRQVACVNACPQLFWIQHVLANHDTTRQ
eukprot:GHUV01051431.1.p1 GENE.GHUV01051431.1~~GHUV01051431.1.p1  ORF type:complete len:161 (-),score=23.61 GHUV01051431.1:73-555(-)